MMDFIIAYIEYIRQYLVIFILMGSLIIALRGKPRGVIRIMYQFCNLEEPMPKLKIVYLLVIGSSAISVIFYNQYCKFAKKHNIHSKREYIEKAYNYYINSILFALIALLIMMIYSFCEKHLQLKNMRNEIRKYKAKAKSQNKTEKDNDIKDNAHYKLD